MTLLDKSIIPRELGVMTSSVTQRGHHKGREAPNKGRSYPPEILTSAEVEALLHACSNRASTGIRNRALIAMLYRGGLRLGEALVCIQKTSTLNMEA